MFLKKINIISYVFQQGVCLNILTLGPGTHVWQEIEFLLMIAGCCQIIKQSCSLVLRAWQLVLPSKVSEQQVLLGY